MRILIGSDDTVAAYIANATGDRLHKPFRTVGIYGAGGLIGGWAIDDFTGFGVSLSGAGSGMMLRSARQALCDLVFGYLGCRRMQIVVRKSNKRMLKLAPRLGFSFEGKLRRYFGTEDGMIYSLLGEEAIAQGHWAPRKVAA